MHFEGKQKVSKPFIDNMGSKIEKGLQLDLPITFAELKEECSGDPLCEQALDGLVEYAIRYSNDVWNMSEALRNRKNYTDEEWKEIFPQMDDARSRLHDTLIDSIKILSRHLNNAERNTSWMKTLMPAGKVERAACGKFAIMLTYSMYVK